MDERRRRIAENEALFRTVNDEISAVEERFSGGDRGRASEFVCECGDAGCRERLAITPPEYEAVRAHPQRFIVLNGHEIEDAEAVVETYEHYRVVEKLGGARVIAADTDPRP